MTEKAGMKLPNSLIKKDKVTIFPEGAMGYLIGPTMAMLANSVLANYFNTYMSNVPNTTNTTEITGIQVKNQLAHLLMFSTLDI